jgi:cation diffusion facilitator family transporter
MNKTLLSTQQLTLSVGILLLLLKFCAYFITQSNAILTDALESIVNVVAGGFGLFSLSIALRPKDENHPYGHGKIEFISAAIEGSLIVVAGVVIIIKSIDGFLSPTAVTALDLGILLTAIAGAVNYGLGWYVAQKGAATGSMVLQASGAHLQSDGWSTLGLLLGLGILRVTDWWWVDPALALLFGLIIMRAGIIVLRDSLAGIMDEVDYHLVEEIVLILKNERRPSCIDIHNLRVIKYGTALHLDCHMTIPWYYDTRQAHDEVDALEELLASHTEKPIEFFVHVDPCIPASCAICSVENCPVRQQPWQQEIDWTVENVLLNQKHFLEAQDLE